MFTNKFMSGLGQAGIQFTFEKAKSKDDSDRLIIDDKYYINLSLGDAFLYRFEHKGMVGVLVDIYGENDIEKLVTKLKE